MRISSNILKHHLKNAYFLSGTACGGKTTMAKILSEKHGFILYNGSIHHEGHREVATPDEQPNLTRVFLSWECYFNRPVSEYWQWLSDCREEQLEMILVDLLKLPNDQKIMVDMHLTPEVAKEITDFERVAFLIAEPDLVIRDYFDRDDHRDMLECIMSLSDPDKALKNVADVLAHGVKKDLESVYESGLFYIKRDENSTTEETLRLLERHLNL